MFLNFATQSFTSFGSCCSLKMSIFPWLLNLSIIICTLCYSGGNTVEDAVHGTWVLNYPHDFHNRTAHLGDKMEDVRRDHIQLEHFKIFIDRTLPHVGMLTDGEEIDAIEHYFWGQKQGLAIELGAMDGSAKTKSQTVDMENLFGWRRILIEGNPSFSKDVVTLFPNSFCINAAVCAHHQKVHFVDAPYTGGILEYMPNSTIKEHFPHLYSPAGLAAIDLTKHKEVRIVDCLPLSNVVHKARTRHVHYFVLSAQGAELEVLKSINWSLLKVDVLCVEVDPPNRPAGYPQAVTAFLQERGYVSHMTDSGRNIWFRHSSFTPKARPNLSEDCYNGARKSVHAAQLAADPSTAAFKPCAMGFVG